MDTQKSVTTMQLLGNDLFLCHLQLISKELPGKQRAVKIKRYRHS